MAAISLTFTSSEIGNLCRTCLSRESELYSLFNTHVHTTTLNHIITEITGIEIEPNDDLPKSVCCECRKNATIAFDFKKKSQESAGILKNYLKVDDSSSFKVEIKEITQSKNCDVKIEQNYTETDDFDIYNDLESLEDGYQETENIKKEQLLHEAANIPFQCNICSTILDSGEEFSKHLKNTCLKVECQDAVESFCPLCGICFDANKSLTKHMWDDHAELMGPKKKGRPKNLNTTTILNKLSKNGLEVKPVRYNKYCCLFCEKSYGVKEDLVQHAKVHKDDKVYCCIICKKMYLNFSKYKQHFCLGENNLKTENMNGASTDLASNQHKTLEFLSETSYKNLLSTCDTPENVSLPQGCSFCSEVFVLNTDFLNHIDSEHPELSQRCNICLKVFASVKAAARHRDNCKTIERKHECSTCGLKFVYELSLNKHILRYHEGQCVSVNFMDPEYKSQNRNYECDICNKRFRRKATLAKHTKIHTTNAKIFECDVCKRTFNRKDNLKSHKTTHEPRSPSKSVKMSCLCVYCGRSFNNSSNLIVHVRRHTGEKPYKCDFCGKGFPRSSDLQCHRRSHTGEKPCECKICGKSFSRSNKLTRHMRIHTGQKPYQCHFCDKAFSQSNDLTLHVRRHTGDKPYICEVCGDRFIQGTALQNHRRAHGHFPTTSSEVTAHSQQLVQSIKTININYLSSDNKLIQE